MKEQKSKFWNIYVPNIMANDFSRFLSRGARDPHLPPYIAHLTCALRALLFYLIHFCVKNKPSPAPRVMRFVKKEGENRSH